MYCPWQAGPEDFSDTFMPANTDAKDLVTVFQIEMAQLKQQKLKHN